MFYSRHSTKAMMTAPHHLAAEAGADILRNGGNAVDAMVAAAAAIAVVYPHMNSIGGDGFWLISEPGQPVRAIDACGPAAAAADIAFFKERGYSSIPARGPHAALTVAGTIGGWQKALEISKSWGSQNTLSDLLKAAIDYAENGIAVSEGQQVLTTEKYQDLKDVSGFSDQYLNETKQVYPAGSLLKQPKLAQTLKHLSEHGLDDFYRGGLARQISKGLAEHDSPLRLSDFENYRAKEVTPLSLSTSLGELYNLPAPTQGISSLMILGLFDRLNVKEANGFDHIHGLVEATKQAFLLRNSHVCDPEYMSVNPQDWLESDFLDHLCKKIDMKEAKPWPYEEKPGDTIWMGCADQEGRVVSFIQSIYWEYGSGFVVPETGIVWQNRGMSFSLEETHFNRLEPKKRPFHTLNPALARFKDGRTLAYGTMGGEGQPQTQAALYSRYAYFNTPLQQAISQPRWLLGRTWGDESTTLKLESRFDNNLVSKLKEAGHDVEILDEYTSVMGHAGAVCVQPDGIIEGANDPRSDGACIAL